MLHLLISASGHLYFDSEERACRSEEALGITAKKARVLSTRPRALVHFFLWESETWRFYSEVAKAGDIPELEDFFARARSQTGSRLTEEDFRTGITVPVSVRKAFPEIQGVLGKMGIETLAASQSAIKSGVGHLRKWEHDLQVWIIGHSLARYSHWKTAAPRGAYILAPTMRAEHDLGRDNKLAFMSYCQDLLGECPVEKRHEVMEATKVDVEHCWFDAGAYNAKGFYLDGEVFPYSGVNWILQTTAGEFKVRLLLSPYYDDEAESQRIDLGFSKDLPEEIRASLNFCDMGNGTPGDLFDIGDFLDVLADKAEKPLPEDIEEIIQYGSVDTYCGISPFEGRFKVHPYTREALLRKMQAQGKVSSTA